ncbi:hypothetical protein, partial [Massilia atriviolacea]
ELAAFQPSQRYVLIDQQRLDLKALDANDDLLALLFRIELSQIPDVLHTHLRVLATWLRDTPQTSLRNSVWAWWKALLARRNDDQEVPDLNSVEVADMESTTLSWAEQLRQIGFQQGVALAEKAKAEGMAEGKAEGKAEGMAEGHLMALRGVFNSLLRIRFGTVPDLAAQRIEHANRTELEHWIERTVDAPSVEALFDA